MSKIRLIFASEEQRQSYEKFVKEWNDEFASVVLWGKRTHYDHIPDLDNSELILNENENE